MQRMEAYYSGPIGVAANQFDLMTIYCT